MHSKGSPDLAIQGIIMLTACCAAAGRSTCCVWISTLLADHSCNNSCLPFETVLHLVRSSHLAMKSSLDLARLVSWSHISRVSDWYWRLLTSSWKLDSDSDHSGLALLCVKRVDAQHAGLALLCREWCERNGREEQRQVTNIQRRSLRPRWVGTSLQGIRKHSP
jgi:hypothetical protein